MEKGIRNLIIICIILIIITGALLIFNKNNEKEEEANLTKTEEQETVVIEHNISEIKGETTNNIYRSDLGKIAFELPSGWKFKSNEEIKSQVESVSIDSESEDNIDYLYDMMATNNESGSSVSIMYGEISNGITVDMLIEKLKKSFEGVEIIYYNVNEIETEKLGETKYKSLTVKMPKYNLVQKYYLKQEGNFLVEVTITYKDGEDTLENITKYFK